jgi:hypothetical protein
VSDQMQAGMAEATRLTSEGRLAEATAVIQRTLGSAFAPAPDGSGGADGPVERSSRVVNEASHTEAVKGPQKLSRPASKEISARTWVRSYEHPPPSRTLGE